MRRFSIALGLMLLTSGCALHIGSETHTHVYDRGKLDSDDALQGKIGKIIAYAAKVSGEETPLKGYEWNEKKITALEKEQKKKGAIDDDEGNF